MADVRRLGLMQVQSPGCIAGNLVGDAAEMIGFGDGASERARGSVDMKPLGLAKLVDAE